MPNGRRHGAQRFDRRAKPRITVHNAANATHEKNGCESNADRNQIGHWNNLSPNR
jgi:hypothetical protein